MKVQGRFLGDIDAHRLIIEKKANVEFARTVKARGVEVHGKVSANIHCDGCVKVASGGVLEGVIHARSINVEKGGFFSGELVIGQEEVTQGDLLGEDAGFAGGDGPELRPA